MNLILDIVDKKSGKDKNYQAIKNESFIFLLNPDKHTRVLGSF